MSLFILVQELGWVSGRIVIVVVFKNDQRKICTYFIVGGKVGGLGKLVIMVKLMSALHWVGTTKKRVDLLQRWRFWKTGANTMHWKVKRKLNHQWTGEQMRPSGTVLFFPRVGKSWSKEKKQNEDRKCFSFYRQKKRRLTCVWRSEMGETFRFI